MVEVVLLYHRIEVVKVLLYQRTSKHVGMVEVGVAEVVEQVLHASKKVSEGGLGVGVVIVMYLYVVRQERLKKETNQLSGEYSQHSLK